MACYPTKDKPGTIWNIESHVNDKGIMILICDIFYLFEESPFLQ